MHCTLRVNSQYGLYLDDLYGNILPYMVLYKQILRFHKFASLNLQLLVQSYLSLRLIMLCLKAP